MSKKYYIKPYETPLWLMVVETVIPVIALIISIIALLFKLVK